jgi:hypothetical protein
VRWLKEKLRRTGTLCACVCALVGSAGPARAQAGDPLLVLQERSHPQAGLTAALRIQLMDATPVRVREWRPAGTLGERIAAATELGRAEHALAVVWTEAPMPLPDGGLEAVLYIAARSESRALLEVVRVPGGRGADLTRSLALKVEEVIEELRRSDRQLSSTVLRPPAEPSAPSAEPPPSAAGATVPPSAASAAVPPSAASAVVPPSAASAAVPPSAAPATNPPSWGLLLATGARLSSFGWARWGLGVSAGPTLQSDAWTAALRLGLDWYPDATHSRAGARVELAELTPLLLASAQWRHDGFGLGARAGIGISFFDARGETALGRSGSASVRTASALLGLAIERAIVQGLSVAASLDWQIHALHQRFDVNGTTQVELQRSGVVAALELVWYGP